MFEVKATDLAGRIGRLRTKSGTIETPALLPVIHPIHQQVPVRELSNIGFKAVMTNAYITMKHYGDTAAEIDIHRIIDFDGVVMTDSGGYQVLEYGDIAVDPVDMAKFEESISTDIAITLDTPTTKDASRMHAQKTVRSTIQAAKETLLNVSRHDILWTGPIQGGAHIDLVRSSARKMSKLGFDIFALGSPTEIMKAYDFTLLTQMIYAAKKNIPLSKPLHLFGAGHPLTLPLAVALGCDLFDSASYMLYAKDGRYMTEYGTVRLDNLSFFPCSCPICSTHTVKELLSYELYEGRIKLATHNLYQLHREVETIKQVTREGRLWSYVGMKARAHPGLWEAYIHMGKYIDLLEDGTPSFKSRGAFFFTSPDHFHPDSIRHTVRLRNVTIPKKRRIMIVIPEDNVKPFYSSPIYTTLTELLGDYLENVQFFFLSSPFGLVPVEVSDIYPLSQYESSPSFIADPQVSKDLIDRTVSFLEKNKKSRSIILIKRDGYIEVIKKISRRLEGTTVLDWKDDCQSARKILEAVQKLLGFNR